MKKIFKILLISIILATVYSYVLVITNLPDTLIVFEGENLKINTIYGLNINLKDKTYETMLTSSNMGESTFNQKGKTILTASLFDFNIKDIEVNIIEKTKVIPIGEVVGIKMYTKGVLVVGMAEIQGKKPYSEAGIQEGDIITNVDNEEIKNTSDLIESINKSAGEQVEITYINNGQTKECNITPVRTEKGEYKIGLWVRDSAAGIGTVTFYEPESKNFVALGHGITDIDTNKLINISSGELVTTQILSIVKGEIGTPGKIQGTIEKQKNIGTIYKNTTVGIYGEVNKPTNLLVEYPKPMEIAMRNEIQLGKAKILCNLESNQGIEEYEIEIVRKFTNNNYDNKSMLIRVTDERLIEKTGGIVQGMSGSPIIQNGKFIGAVTHVLVSSPDTGYAVFADTMIKEMRTIN